MQSGLLLDVVVRESPTILQLLSRKDEPLLVRGDSFLVLTWECKLEVKNLERTNLDFSFHILNGIGRFHLQGDSLASQRLHENLHPASQPQHEV